MALLGSATYLGPTFFLGPDSSTPPYRDVLVYDGSGTPQNSINLTLPGTLVTGDLGFLALSWTADAGSPLTTVSIAGGTSGTWSQLVPPTVNGGMAFALFSKPYNSATDSGHAIITLGATRRVEVVGVWVSSVSLDVVGPISPVGGPLSANLTAPSITTSAVAGDEVLSFFGESIRHSGETATIDGPGIVLASQGGIDGTSMVFVSALTQSAMGTTNPVDATYSDSAGVGIAVQVGLIPAGAALGYPIKLGPSLTLTTRGVVVVPAGFGTSVTLSATGYAFSRINLTANVALAAKGAIVAQGVQPFTVHVALATVGTNVASARFAARVSLATVGKAIITRAAPFAAHVSLTAIGRPIGKAAISRTITVTLVASGKPVIRANPQFTAHVVFSAHVPGLTFNGKARFKTRIDVGYKVAAVHAKAPVSFSPKVTLRVNAHRVVTKGTPLFVKLVHFSVVTTKPTYVVGAASFHAQVRFKADGFRPESEPIGITLKAPLIDVDDPDWAEPSGATKTWTVNA